MNDEVRRPAQIYDYNIIGAILNGSIHYRNLSNYVYEVDLSKSRRVAYYTQCDGELWVYNAKVISCRTDIAEEDREFYISESRVGMLKAQSSSYWGYMNLAWVDPELAAHMVVTVNGDTMHVGLSDKDFNHGW